MVMGAPTLVGIFEEQYYAKLPGGILEGLGRLFQGDTTLYVYPMKAGPDAPVVDAVSLPLAPLSRRLYWYLLESGQIQSVREFREEQLHVYPDYVLAKIQSGDARWEQMVRECFDRLYVEGESTGKLIVINLHPHVIGQASRIRHLANALGHIADHEHVWFATGAEIAEWWQEQVSV